MLRRGGPLVVETMHRDRLVSVFQERRWDPLPDGGLRVEERSFDAVEGVNEAAHTIVRPDGMRETVTYRLRVYTATELAGMGREAGFERLEFYGDYEGGPFTTQTRLLLVAH